MTGAQLIDRWLALKAAASRGRITPAELDRALTTEWLRFIADAKSPGPTRARG